VRYANSAAKFWLSLIEEVRHDFPQCSAFEVEGSTAGLLSPEQLHPELEFERDIQRLWHASMEEMLRETMAQIELMGPPGTVRIRLLADEAELLARELPTECVDTEIFPYLVVWLLQWSGVSALGWNEAKVEGRFTAVDRVRERMYQVSLVLSNEHLCEGLFRRRLRLTPSVSSRA
jgi:hypothetical protein